MAAKRARRGQLNTDDTNNIKEMNRVRSGSSGRLPNVGRVTETTIPWCNSAIRLPNFSGPKNAVR